MDFIELNFEPIDIDMQSPLVWAYIGDAVYEMFIRTYLVNTTNLKPHRLHIESIKYVKAKAQAEILRKIFDDLTNEEKEYYDKQSLENYIKLLEYINDSNNIIYFDNQDDVNSKCSINIPDSGRFERSIPNAIGTSSSGSNPFLIAR